MTKPLFEIFDDVFVRTTPRSLLSLGALRLDASFYDQDSQAAYAAMRVKGLRSDALSDISEVYRSNLRERVFVNPTSGIALLTGSSLGVIDDENQKYVSRPLTRNIAVDTLHAGDILISAAGTVGKVDLVWKNHEGKLGGEDLVRLRVKRQAIPFGYLYAFFRSPVGNAVFSHHASGSVISRVYPEQVATLSIPRLQPAIEAEVHSLILKSFDCRRKSQELLLQAYATTQTVNGLAELPSESWDKSESFVIPSRVLFIEESNFRLDAHFYNSSARAARHNIEKCCPSRATVAELTETVFFCNRFSRTFVEQDYGINYLAGKNIVQIRPEIEKYLSIADTAELEDYRLQKNWTLITCSGTIGRTCFVWNNFEAWVATHDLIRVVAEPGRVDPAYLYAFLSSRYGYEQILRFRHGSVIDHVTPEQIGNIIVPLASPPDQKDIGDQVRKAYEERAHALKLEDEAQALFLQEIRTQDTVKVPYHV